jgi:zinc transporter ZupT
MVYHEIKIPAIIGFFFIQLLFAFLPICIKKFRKLNLLMSLSNCFTAGLFVATGFVHILPEANEIFQEGIEALEHAGHDHGSDHSSHSHGISYSHLTVLLAFSLILFIEKVLLNTNKKSNNHDKKAKGSKKYVSNVTLHKESSLEPLNKKNENEPVLSKPEHKDSEKAIIVVNADELNPQEIPKEKDQMQDDHIETKADDLNNKESKNQETKKEKHHEHDDHDNEHNHSHDHITFSNESSIWSIIVILFALGIHAFMANLFVGIENNRETLITLIIAIALHKWSEGLAIGIILIKKKFSKCKNIFIIIFITMFSLLGGITGLLLESANDIAKGAMLSISAAAFIYIAVCEILIEEFKYADWKYLKFLLYSLGVGLVMLLFLVH